MKIILIKPPQTGKNLRRQIATYEPLGLEYLSAWIKRSGFIAKILDFHIRDREVLHLGNSVFRVGMSQSNIKQKMIEEQPDVIGISCLFREYSLDVVDIINLCKENLPNALIILGGQDASTRPQFYFNYARPDLIVFGEGELTFEDILNRLAQGNSIRQIPGTIEFKDGDVIKNDARERINNLDVLPLPERNLSPYLDKRIQKLTYPFAKRLPVAIIQSSRGCQMRCVFCDIISVWNKWVCRSPKNVVDEIQYLNSEFGINEFSFIDDNFMFNKERVKQICSEIIKRKINIFFEVNPGISVWTIDREVIDLMVKAGLYRICLPIESGARKTLEFIGKPVDLQKTIEMIDYCNRLGLYTYGNIIIGFPFEEKRDIEESFNWAFRSNLDMVHFLIAEPYEGAEMFKIYVENNWIDLKEKNSFEVRSFRTKYFTLEELNLLRNKAQLRYFLTRFAKFLKPKNFKNIVPKINSFAKLGYFIKLLFFILSGFAIPENFAIFKLFKKRKNILLNYR